MRRSGGSTSRAKQARFRRGKSLQSASVGVRVRYRHDQFTGFCGAGTNVYAEYNILLRKTQYQCLLLLINNIS